MTRILIPLILVCAGIGLFVVYTNPNYQQVKVLSVQDSQYNDALNKAQELRSLRESLMVKRNSFAQSDIDKLQKVLPDNVDTIRLILDINNIASRHGLTLSNLKLSDASDSSTARSTAAVGSAGDPVGSLSLAFSVNTNYDTLLTFLQDVEHSERILDVQRLSFKGGAGNSSYDITLRTYWLH